MDGDIPLLRHRPGSGLGDLHAGQGRATQTGNPVDLTNGCVRLEVWSAIGTARTALRTSATTAEGTRSVLAIPYTVTG